MSENSLSNVNQTLYIPLFGKAYVSRRALILHDRKAEEIWDAVQLPLKRRSRSKWLAFYMGMRAAVFDKWLNERLKESPGATVLHIGCGLDSRVLRAAGRGSVWYDVDFPEVIAERKRYYAEEEGYIMLGADVSKSGFLNAVPRAGKAIVVMEGVSMYLAPERLRALLSEICLHFDAVHLLVDCYTTLAAKLSKLKNPVNEVGVHTVYGLDDPTALQAEGLCFMQEHSITPNELIAELQGIERRRFRLLYAGKLSKKLYKLYEYKKGGV
ncbi:MAG: class I SAM-dependent methyltransferase [Clostridia bacterium]|nr:class I SAM-dependent methyltransferase [Clostridia bacterium]